MSSSIFHSICFGPISNISLCLFYICASQNLRKLFRKTLCPKPQNWPGNGVELEALFDGGTRRGALATWTGGDLWILTKEPCLLMTNTVPIRIIINHHNGINGCLCLGIITQMFNFWHNTNNCVSKIIAFTNSLTVWFFFSDGHWSILTCKILFKSGETTN